MQNLVASTFASTASTSDASLETKNDVMVAGRLILGGKIGSEYIFFEPRTLLCEYSSGVDIPYVEPEIQSTEKLTLAGRTRAFYLLFSKFLPLI